MIARQPTSIVPAVHGMIFARPPIFRMSFVWHAWITEPEQRKSRLLKKAWVTR